MPALGQKDMAGDQGMIEELDADFDSDTVSLGTAERLGREAGEELELAQQGEVRAHDTRPINGLR